MMRSRAIYLLLAALWTAIAGASLFWNLRQIEHSINVTMRERGRALFTFTEIVREWNARHGGVYVPVTAGTPPNPYLEIPNRDLDAGGLALTMVNPAYMTRQIAEIAAARQDVTLHLTSLNPIRPANKADPWETESLQSFEAGATERIKYDRSGASPSFRYMAPLYVTKACLKCHAKQGYHEGDVRGGISVTMPAVDIVRDQRRQTETVIVLHLIGYLVVLALGATTVATMGRHLRTVEGMRVAQAGIIERQTAELRSANEQLAKVAHEDVLTGIFNRRGFLAIADGLWHRTRRGGEHLSVLMFDIDHFKRTNDTYGHAAGDAVLKAVAERTNCMLRPADVFARYGGEEFIVLLNGTDGDRAAAIANRIRNAFATEAVIHEDRAIGLRASFGVAEAGPDDPDLKAVIDRADAALYRAKAEGRNRVEKG